MRVIYELSTNIWEFASFGLGLGKLLSWFCARIVGHLG